MKKKIIAVLLLWGILLACGGSMAVTAGAEDAPASEEFGVAEQVINSCSLHKETVYSVGKSVPLKSFATGSYEYTLYELEPYGYAILYNNTMDLMEACYEPEAVLPVSAEESGPVFYAGPGNYFVYDGGSLKNTADGSVLEYEAMSQLASMEAEVELCVQESLATLSEGDTVSPQTSTVPSDGIIVKYVKRTYFENLNEIGKNKNGTCTVIAIQMLLGYYDNFICDQYVAAEYESGDGTSESFHQLLNDYVYGDKSEGAIYIKNAAVGINSYLQERGIIARLVSEYATPDKARNKIFSSILSGYPVAASMSTIYGATHNHSVLVYGVQYNPETTVKGSQAKFIVHMGWGIEDTAKVISGAWFYECGYLSNNTHSYGLWKKNSTATHKRICPCGAVQTESHADYWDSSTKKCSRCGYVGNITTVTAVQYPQ